MSKYTSDNKWLVLHNTYLRMNNHKSDVLFLQKFILREYQIIIFSTIWSGHSISYTRACAPSEVWSNVILEDNLDPWLPCEDYGQTVQVRMLAKVFLWAL